MVMWQTSSDRHREIVLSVASGVYTTLSYRVFNVFCIHRHTVRLVFGPLQPELTFTIRLR